MLQRPEPAGPMWRAQRPVWPEGNVQGGESSDMGSKRQPGTGMYGWLPERLDGRNYGRDE